MRWVVGLGVDCGRGFGILRSPSGFSERIGVSNVLAANSAPSSWCFPVSEIAVEQSDRDSLTTCDDSLLGVTIEAD